jgi:hypothetical protein
LRTLLEETGALDYPPSAVVRPFTESIDRSVALQNLQAWILKAWAAILAILATTGVLVVASRTVTARWHELVVRCVLGESRRSLGLRVGSMVVKPVAGGIIGGVCLATLAGRPVAELIAGLVTLPIRDYVLVGVAVAVVSIVVSGVAAWRLASLDPAWELKRSTSPGAHWG